MMHTGVVNGRKRAVNWLVKNGADPNVLNDRSETPLHLCCVKGFSKQLVERLLEAKANVNMPSNLGETPLQLAQRRGLTKLENMLAPFDSGVDRTADTIVQKIEDREAESADVLPVLQKHITTLQEKKSTNVTKKLLNRHEDIITIGHLDLAGTRDDSSNTFLHIAASACSTEIVTTLIRLKCNPNVKNASGKTPLHAACAALQAGNPNAQATIQVLLTANADMSQGDFADDKTPLDCVENKEMRDWLLDATADPNEAVGVVVEEEEAGADGGEISTTHGKMQALLGGNFAPFLRELENVEDMADFAQAERAKKKIKHYLDSRGLRSIEQGLHGAGVGSISEAKAAANGMVTVAMLQDFYQQSRNVRLAESHVKQAIASVLKNNFDPENPVVPVDQFLYGPFHQFWRDFFWRETVSYRMGL